MKKIQEISGHITYLKINTSTISKYVSNLVDVIKTSSDRTEVLTAVTISCIAKFYIKEAAFSIEIRGWGWVGGG